MLHHSSSFLALFFSSLRSILTSVTTPGFLNKRALRETALKGSNGGMEIRRLIGLAGLQPAGPFQYRELLFSLKVHVPTNHTVVCQRKDTILILHSIKLGKLEFPAWNGAIERHFFQAGNFSGN